MCTFNRLELSNMEQSESEDFKFICDPFFILRRKIYRLV